MMAGWTVSNVFVLILTQLSSIQKVEAIQHRRQELCHRPNLSKCICVDQRDLYSPQYPIRRYMSSIRDSLRGGGSASSPVVRVLHASDDATNWSDNSTQKDQRCMALALTATYFAVMGAKCALPATLSLLTSPLTGLTFSKVGSNPQLLMARQLSISTLAIAIGKTLLGPVIDRLGGKQALQLALCSLVVLLLNISMCQSFTTFGVSWILVDFIFSSCWAACINAVHQCFPETDWPVQVGNLAAAARAGNSLAFLFFASILHFFQQRGVRQCWRPVFFAAAIAQIVPIFLLSIYGKNRSSGKAPTKKDKQLAVQPVTSFKASLSTLRREANTPDFWLHLVSRSALMLYASFLLFVPTLMTQVYRTTASTAAQVGSLYALGCFLSVTTLSNVFASLRGRAKLCVVTLFLLIGATGSSLVQLGHVSGFWEVTPIVSAMSFFVWGFSFAIPFYIPPSLYALSRGGKESSATIADVFDIAGFGLLALMNGYTASIAHERRSAWIATFVITSSCSLVAYIALSAVVLREESK